MISTTAPSDARPETPMMSAMASAATIRNSATPWYMAGTTAVRNRVARMRALVSSVRRSRRDRTCRSTSKIRTSCVVAASSVNAVANARLLSDARRERRCTAARIGQSVSPISATAPTTANEAPGLTTSAVTMRARRLNTATVPSTRLMIPTETMFA